MTGERLGNKLSLKDSRELILSHVFERFKLEVERKQDLDEKANNLAGFVGIILSLISGFGLTSLTTFKLPAFEWTFDYFYRISPIITFVVVYASLFLSVFFVLKAMNIKKYFYVPQAFNLIGAFENNTKTDEICQVLYDEYALAISDNMTKNDKEALDISKSIYCLFVSLVVFSVTVILFMVLGGR